MTAQPPELSATAPRVTDLAVSVAARRQRSTSNLEIVLPALVLVFVIGGCFLGPLIWPVPPPTRVSILDANLPVFSPGHLFGTNQLGQDILSQIMYGGRAPIEVGFGVIAISTVVGGSLGAFAAISVGWVEGLIMRVLDIVIAFPPLVLLLVINQGLGASTLNGLWEFSFFAIPLVARVSRSAALRVREMDYMLAAKLSGTSKWRMITRHMAPNILPQLLTLAFLGVGVIVILLVAVSFLGKLTQVTWSNMIYLGQEQLFSNPSLVLIPCAFLFVFILCLNLLSDALRARYATL